MTCLYHVTFNGVQGAAATVQVNAVGSNAICNTNGWTSSSNEVVVQCYDPSGNPADPEFTIALIPPGASPTGLGYVYDDDPFATGNYVPPTTGTYNFTGNAMIVVRQGTGQYQVIFTGMGTAQVQGGLILATANASAARCSANSWGFFAALAYQATVYCTDYAANYTDTQFEVLVLPPVGYAYALTSNANGAVNQAYSLNPGGVAITSAHPATGQYDVTFPNSGIDQGWAVQAKRRAPSRLY